MPRMKQIESQALKVGTRQKLVQAAIQAIAREGYEKANINAISLAAGLAKGTIYNYFSSKPAMMLALIDEIGTAHVGFLSARVRAEVDPRRRMEVFFSAGFEYIEAHPEAASLVLATLYGSSTAFQERLVEVYQPLFQLVGEEILEEGIARGVFRSLDTGSTAAILLTLYLGAGSRRGPDGRILIDPQQLSAFALTGVGR